MNTNTANSRRRLPTSPFQPKPEPVIEKFSVDDRVTHDQYGLGRVIAAEDDVAVTVHFGSQVMRLVSPFAKLTKL